MAYKVTIDFQRGPSYGSTIVANTEQDAKQLAATEARGYGFDAPIKHVIVRPA
jgi:hypothetical protein